MASPGLAVPEEPPINRYPDHSSFGGSGPAVLLSCKTCLQANQALYEGQIVVLSNKWSITNTT